MNFPAKVPGLRLLMIGTAVYGVVWISLEGNLGRVIGLGTAVSLVVTGHLLQRFFGGRSFFLGIWLTVSGIAGLLAGFGSGVLTLGFMALKTGLHGHGPEFRPSELELIVGSLPLWAVVGLIAGLGIGVLVWGFRR